MRKTGRVTTTKYCRVVIHAGGSHRATCVVWGENVESNEVPFTEDYVEFYQVDLDDAGVSVQTIEKIEALPPDMSLESLEILHPLREAAVKRNVLKAVEERLDIKLIYKG